MERFPEDDVGVFGIRDLEPVDLYVLERRDFLEPYPYSSV